MHRSTTLVYQFIIIIFKYHNIVYNKSQLYRGLCSQTDIRVHKSPIDIDIQ